MTTTKVTPLKERKLLIGQVVFFNGMSNSFHVPGMKDWELEFSNSHFFQCMYNKNGHSYSHLGVL